MTLQASPGAPPTVGRLAAAEGETFDVAIVGGGVGGAAVFRELGRRGYRVLLVDRGDFAGGTSQASGMLVWGGLLYLRSLELRTVRALSRERDALLEDPAGEVRVAPFRYLPLRRGGRPPWLVRAALEAYWWLGSRRRARPARTRVVPGLLRPARFQGSLSYEEGALARSDARLVLDWILDSEDRDRVALNRAAAVGARRANGVWHLELEDRHTEGAACARARVLVNAAGVWTDDVAQRLGVRTRHKHVLSKGVYLGLARPPELEEFLAFEMGAHGDTLTLTPWGPVALFGPTETALESLAGAFEPDASDVRFLLERARENLARPVGPEDIVSLRTGVRPLAVERSYSRHEYPLDLSRRHVLDVDRESAALSLYGGKITSAGALAREAADVVARDVTPAGAPLREEVRCAAPTTLSFPGLDAQLLDPAHAARHERCLTLVDYARRRTNLAQWTRRWGLGASGEHRAALHGIAEVLHGRSGAEAGVAELAALAARQDELLASV